MKITKIVKLVLNIAIIAVFVGCGTVETTKITDKTLTANAGDDKTVTINETIKLIGKGTDTDGMIIDYEWKKGLNVLATTASFDYTPSVVGKDTLTFTVTNNDGDSASDTVIITVNKVIEGNQSPQVDAGKDQSITVNNSINLTGTGTDSDGTIVSYEWKKGNDILATTASFDYTPSVVGKDTLILIVTDDEGATASDSVIINVTSSKGTSSNNNKPLILTVRPGRDSYLRLDLGVSNFVLKVKNNLGYTYNYNVDWGDGTSDQGLSGNAEHQYAESKDNKYQEYAVKIDGDFPALDFMNQEQIKSLEQWGSIKWKNMSNTFNFCKTSKVNATDIPDFSEVNDTSFMFARAKAECFLPNMSQWNLANVKNMESMFANTKIDYSEKSALNQDISSWDVSSVTNMKNMFYDSYYNGDFSKWNVSKVTNMEDMFKGAKLSTTNYDKLLNAWSKLDLQKKVTFGLTESSNSRDGTTLGTQYSGNARVARELLKTKFRWTIEDGGIDINNLGDFKPFIGVWKTGYSNSITMPEATYNFLQYNIDWGDGTADTNVTETKKHVYPNEGNYTITISGNYPIYYDHRGYRYLVDVKQWGDNEWKSMESMFKDSPNIIISATDAPNLSAVINMDSMFQNTAFNNPINHWDVSNIKSMDNLFSNNKEFNQDLSSWDVSNVTNMSYMFYRTENFNQDISSWNISNVTNMSHLFSGSIFNQDISSWDVSNVTNMSYMFYAVSSFNQDISSWDVSNVTDMSRMFYKASSFNQNISDWNILKANSLSLEETNLSTENYDKMLMSWVNSDIPDNFWLNVGDTKYSQQAGSAKFELINKHGWKITDGGLAE